jgi:hypothetical protein
MNTVVGLFDHYSNVDWAIEVLENSGVDSDRISVVALDKETIESRTGTNAGLVTSAATGGLVGLLAGLSTFSVPGLGPVIVTGTVAIALFTTLGTTAIGMGFGAATGGLLGALIDLGFSQEDAAFYTEGVKGGNILLYVESASEEEMRIKAILRGAGAIDRNSHPHPWPQETWAAFEEAGKYS